MRYMVEGEGLWVKTVLRGVEFTIEVIIMMLFIVEEATQAGLMAWNTALDNLRLEAAKEIDDGTLQECEEFLFEYWALYALTMIPMNGSYQSFHLATHVARMRNEQKREAYKKAVDLGLDPRPKNKRRWGVRPPGG